MQKVLSKLVIPTDESELLVASTIISKQNNFFQSIIILCERGLFSSADIIVRSLIELYWIIQCIENDHSFVDAFLATDVHDRLEILKKIIRYPDAFNISESALKKYQDDFNFLKKDIKENKIIKYTKSQLAEKANDINGYVTAYNALSSIVHSSVRSLENYIQLSSDNKLESIITGIELSGGEKTLLTAMFYQLRSLNVLLNLFSEEEIASELEVISTKYEQLSHEYIKEFK
jgi:ribosomal protein S17E